MILLPDPWWPQALLAVILLGAAMASLRPLRFIRDCLEGVELPAQWWWALIVVKLLAVTGLIAGIWVPGIAVSANVGIVVYFLCAAAAHLRAHFLGRAFWLNCLGMLGLSVGALVISLAP